MRHRAAVTCKRLHTRADGGRLRWVHLGDRAMHPNDIGTSKALMEGVLLLTMGAACAAELQPPVSSSVRYDGYERTSLYVPVRDGTRLAVDIFRPTRAGA